jgi:hypothetical protein
MSAAQKALAAEKYSELGAYTLAQADPSFIHQHIVDAFAAQTAEPDAKPIKLAFALAGLYLFLEKGFTGKQVQQAHSQMARKSKHWPAFQLPEQRGRITVFDVLAKKPGRPREAMIKKWCISVWEAYRQSHQAVAALVEKSIFSAAP